MTHRFRSTIQALMLVLLMAAVVPTAHAQITINGPSNGFCASQPGDPAAANPAVVNFAYALYGAGQLQDPACGSENVVLDPQSFANRGSGFNIVGAGNLQGLLIRVNKGSGSGFTANVWLTRAGVATVVLTCTVAANTTGAVPDCLDTTTVVPVLDKDVVEIVLTGTPGDTYENIAWYLGKS